MKKKILIACIVFDILLALIGLYLWIGYSNYKEDNPTPPVERCQPPIFLMNWERPPECSIDRSFKGYLKSLSQ